MCEICLQEDADFYRHINFSICGDKEGEGVVVVVVVVEDVPGVEIYSPFVSPAQQSACSPHPHRQGDRGRPPRHTGTDVNPLFLVANSNSRKSRPWS